MIDCQKCVEQLYGYLDRELTQAELRDVESHLEECPPCARLFNFEAGVLRLIGTRARETCAPPELRSRISALCQSPPNIDR